MQSSRCWCSMSSAPAYEPLLDDPLPGAELRSLWGAAEPRLPSQVHFQDTARISLVCLKTKSGERFIASAHSADGVCFAVMPVTFAGFGAGLLATGVGGAGPAAARGRFYYRAAARVAGAGRGPGPGEWFCVLKETIDVGMSWLVREFA